jgi:multisubunit Na+/H+ antiporter MnhF subunit
VNGSTIAALGTVVVGLAGCGWVVTGGPRRDRVAALLTASLVVCLALTLLSAGHESLTALDLALLAGVAGPLGTVVVAARGRGLAAGGGHRRRRR